MERQIESERIINLVEYELLICKARTDMMWLKKNLEEKNYEAVSHLVGQIDLALHQMEEHEFQIERRTITVNDACECQ